MHPLAQFESALRLLDGRLLMAGAERYRLGLPEGLARRLTWRRYGDHLSVGYVGRLDQIHFKLYAAVDQFGGYHSTDLQSLQPTDDELLAAARWSITHDPSPGYRQALQAFLREFGHGHLADRIPGHCP